MKCSLDLVTFLYVDIWGIHLLKRFIIKYRFNNNQNADLIGSAFFYVKNLAVVSGLYHYFTKKVEGYLYSEKVVC